MLTPVVFVGTSLDALRAFPAVARQRAGYQLDRVQRGLDPDDWKPMQGIGAGVREIRVRDATSQFRVMYVVRHQDAVYVLHCFQKKTRRTSGHDLDLAAKRFRDVIRGER